MKVTGIIAEYNPLHNGHEYHIRRARELTGSDYCVVILSGNFVQRGEPAITDKYTRTGMALSAGADLVLELPAPYASASAEIFAEGAIRILNGLHIIDTLCFGSENGETESLWQCASFLTEESPEFQSSFRRFLKQGLTYPQARTRALISRYPDFFKTPDRQAMLNMPNNILGIEYCKVLQKLNSSIRPVSVPRIGDGYNNTRFSSSTVSSTAIRNALATEPLNSVRNYIPEESYRLLNNIWDKTSPVLPDDFSLLLHFALLKYRDCPGKYTVFSDITEDLSDKIEKNLPEYTNFTDFSQILKSKDLTLTRIQRMLIHIILGITKKDISLFTAPSFTGYARILGFRKEASGLLTELKKHAEIPLISKPADARKLLKDQPDVYALFQSETRACEIYNSVITNKYGVSMKHEYTNPVIIL